MTRRACSNVGVRILERPHGGGNICYWNNFYWLETRAFKLRQSSSVGLGKEPFLALSNFPRPETELCIALKRASLTKPSWSNKRYHHTHLVTRRLCNRAASGIQHISQGHKELLKTNKETTKAQRGAQGFREIAGKCYQLQDHSKKTQKTQPWKINEEPLTGEDTGDLLTIPLSKWAL